MTQEEKLKIIIVDDDIEIINYISSRLGDKEFSITAFTTGRSFIQHIVKGTADLILLDINLPDFSGFELLEAIREEGIQTPVIFLTGVSDGKQVVSGLNQGADDYITKPFKFNELLARVKAVSRRFKNTSSRSGLRKVSKDEEPFQFCGAKIIPSRFEIEFPSSKTLKVGKKEIGIMAFFARNPDKVLPRELIIRAIWGKSANIRSRSLDQYIVKIRGIFAENKCDTSQFRTVHAVGYSYDKNS